LWDAQASDGSPRVLFLDHEGKREFHGVFMLRGTPKNSVELRVNQTEGGHRVIISPAPENQFGFFRYLNRSLLVEITMLVLSSSDFSKVSIDFRKEYNSLACGLRL
jgi:hypothetical protein